MAARALLLVHDPAEERRHRVPGALLPALGRRNVDYDVVSFVGGTEPVPALDRYDLVIVLGSNESAFDASVKWIAREHDFVASAVDAGLPVLGICFGAQLLALVLGGSVTRAAEPEVGFVTIYTDDPALIPAGPWMQLHGDTFTPPPNATEIARNVHSSQAFRLGKSLGVQFHPEMTLDSFNSWADRWAAVGETPGRLDIEAIRAEIARYEKHSTQLCDQLVGAFCTRALDTITVPNPRNHL